MSTHLPRKWSFFLLLVLLSGARSTSAQPALAKPSVLKLKHSIFTFCFIPNSSILVSFELAANQKKATGAIQLWNTQTAALVKEMTFQSPPVSGAVFSSDGMTLATAHGNQVLLWHSRTGKLKQRIYTGAEKVALSPDGKFMAVVGGSKGKEQDVVRLWDATTGKWLGRLTHGADELNTSTGKPLKKYFVEDERKHEMRRVWWHPDGKGVVATDNYHICRIWDFATRRLNVSLPEIYPGQRFAISSNIETIADVQSFYLTHSPDGDVYLGVLNLHDLQTSKTKVLTVDGGNGGDLESATGAMSFSPDDKTLAAEVWKGEDGRQTIRFYDVESGKLMQKVEDPFQSGPSDLAFSSDGKTMALANGKSLALWKLN